MIERPFEQVVFASRWFMAPVYLALAGSLAMLMVKVLQEFVHLVPRMLSISDSELILAILSLVDLALAGNLMVIVILSGYENFVSKIDTEGHRDRPEWMGKVDFSGLKLKLMGSIAAISAIQLLKSFMNVRETSAAELGWMVGIHLALVVSGVLLSLMDRLSGAHAR